MQVVSSAYARKRIAWEEKKRAAKSRVAVPPSMQRYMDIFLAMDEVDREDKKYLVIHQQKLKAAEKIKAFEVRIEYDRTSSRMRFHYEGDHHTAAKMASQAKEAIMRVFEESAEWLTVKDLLAYKIGQDTTVRAAVKGLEREGLIICKTRKEATAAGLPLRGDYGKHNEKVYFRFDAEPEQLDLDAFNFDSS